jgi:hypothetical protein
MSWLGVSRDFAMERGGPYVNIVLQFHPARAVKFDLLQCLARLVVGYTFGVLYSPYCCGLVQVALVVHIELAEGILKTEDITLLELRILPVLYVSTGGSRKEWATYLWSLITFIVEGWI